MLSLFLRRRVNKESLGLLLARFKERELGLYSSSLDEMVMSFVTDSECAHLYISILYYREEEEEEEPNGKVFGEDVKE